MPEPHLLPTAADLVKLGWIIVVAALTVGMGFLAGARRLETAFFSGWGMACLMFAVIGTWSALDLGWVAAAAAALGAGGLLRRLVRPARSWQADECTGLRVLLIAAPFIVLVLGMSDIAWDDFAFWVPNLLHLCVTHHFPTLAQPVPSSVMPAYPYGLALPGFAVHMLGGDQVDTIAFVWNLFAVLAGCAAFSNVIVQRMQLAGARLTPGILWSVAALGVLLAGMGNPAFVSKIVLANMGDSATASGLALLSALLFEYLSDAQQTAAKARLLLQISLTCCAVIFIRQANPALLALLFLSAAAGLALFLGRASLPSAGKLAAVLAPPLLLSYSWTHYADLQIPHGSHYLLPWSAWHWQLFGSTLAAASRVLVRKVGYTAMLLAMGCIVACYIVSRLRGRAAAGLLPQEPASAVIATTITGLAVGNIAFLLFCYLGTSFFPDEAKSAIAFWRFISQTGQALTIGFACVVPVEWLAPCLHRVWLQRALTVAVFLLPVFAVSTYRDDLTSPVPRLRTVADRLDHTLPPGASITLLDISGNGFAAVVAKYQMTVVERDARPVSLIADPGGIPLARVRALNLTSDYVWLAQGSHAFGPIFGTTTSNGCSYLFVKSAATFRLEKSWDLGRYGWSIAPWARDHTAAHDCAG